jgi:hypothetical protein
VHHTTPAPAFSPRDCHPSLFLSSSLAFLVASWRRGVFRFRAHVRQSVESLLQQLPSLPCRLAHALQSRRCDPAPFPISLRLHACTPSPSNRILPPIARCNRTVPPNLRHCQPPATSTIALQPWPLLHASPSVGLTSDTMHSFKAHPQSYLHHRFILLRPPLARHGT